MKGRQVPLIRGTKVIIEQMKATATEGDDVDMLQKISKYENPSHILYHKCCKSKFQWRCKKHVKGKEEMAWHLKRKCRSDAYTDLCSFIRERVVNNNECLFYTFIKDKYLELLHEQYNDVPSAVKPEFFSTQNLEKQLLATFYKEIKIIFVDNKKFLAPYSDNIINNQEFFKKMEMREGIYNIGKLIR